MSGQMNWRRNNYQLSARRGGSISLADEYANIAGMMLPPVG
jgi:hypothetical protein